MWNVTTIFHNMWETIWQVKLHVKHLLFYIFYQNVGCWILAFSSTYNSSTWWMSIIIVVTLRDCEEILQSIFPDWKPVYVFELDKTKTVHRHALSWMLTPACYHAFKFFIVISTAVTDKQSLEIKSSLSGSHQQRSLNNPAGKTCVIKIGTQFTHIKYKVK